MNPKNRLAGRFLPSRVYARWKWTVRFGLAALPLILFIAGSVTLYFSPGRYRSTVVFEYLGKRTPAEAVALLKSQAVISLASQEVKTSELLGVDSETAFEIISGIIGTKVDPGTGFIELTVDTSQGALSRDLAVALPKALDSYEKSRAASELAARIEAAGEMARDAEDLAEEKRTELSKWFLAHPGEAQDPLAQLAIDGLRGNWQHAVSRVHDVEDRRADLEFELSNWQSVIQTHSQPVIANSPLAKDTGESLGAVIFGALATGLAFALGVPYLLELAFPRRRRTFSTSGKTWSEEPGDVKFTEFPLNG